MNQRKFVCAAVLLVLALGPSAASARAVAAQAADDIVRSTPPPGWSTTTSTHTHRGLLGATTGLDGLIYAIGGYTCIPDCGTGQLVYLRSMEIYNPKIKVWSTGGSMHVARAGLAAVTGSDGRIYAIGGGKANIVGQVFGAVYGTLEAYSPTTQKWTLLAPMPTPRLGLAAVFGADGRIYAIGGFDIKNNPLSVVEAYSPTSNTWTTVASMPTPSGELAGVRDRYGRIYAIGGSAGATAERYTISTNSWTTVAPMPTPRDELAGARGPDGRLYLLGGFDSFGFETNAAEAYDPISNSWRAIAPMPSAEAELAAVRGTDGRIYAIDGADGFGGPCCAFPSNRVQVLTI